MNVNKSLTFAAILIGSTVCLLAYIKPSVVKFQNGFTVILSPTENTEAACLLTYHLSGVRDNPDDIKGASYLYQYLMFLGTQHLDPYDRIMFVKKNGGEGIGRVNYDNSFFYQIIPEDKLGNAIWLESERLKSLKITDQQIDIQKNNLHKRIKRLLNSNVSFRAKEWVRSMAFENTAYEKPIYGDVEKILTFNNVRIRNIYDNFRNLPDIIMVVSGNFNASQVMQLISKNFSYSFPRRSRVQQKYKLEEPRKNYVYKNWLIDELPGNFVLVGIRTPAKLGYDFLLFDFIRYYLLDERISKLDKMVNRDNNLNVNIDHEYSSNIESNAILIKFSSSSRLNLDKTKYILEKELEALRMFPISSNNLKIVKSLMELDFFKNMNKIEKRSLMLAENYHLFGNLNFEKNHIKRIRKITQYDIMEISKKYLTKENLVILNVYKK